MPPEGTQTATVVEPAKAQKQLRGLPFVKVHQDVHHGKVRLDFHGLFSATYEQMLWFLLITAWGPFLFFVYRDVLPEAENFGFNLHYILMMLVYAYTMDSFSKFLVDMFSNKKGRIFRLFSLFDDMHLIIYSLVLPYMHHDPKAHLIASVWRDLSIATGSDLFRIYFWPDNLHNRKRVANFQDIMTKEGVWFWGLMFKTPICRTICEHGAMLYFIQPDVPFSMSALLFFPAKILVYELVTDFIYYWMHRGLHVNQFIYKAVHKLHHSSKCPTGLNASAMSVSECFSTFAITDFLAPALLHTVLPMTVTEWAMYTCWLTSIEVYGHSGLVLDQNEMSLWRMGLSGILTGFGVRLMTKDHELHHWHNTVNFGKRTQIWDKLFGTYDYTNLTFCSDACISENEDNLKKKRS